MFVSKRSMAIEAKLSKDSTAWSGRGIDKAAYLCAFPNEGKCLATGTHRSNPVGTSCMERVCQLFTA